MAAPPQYHHPKPHQPPSGAPSPSPSRYRPRPNQLPQLQTNFPTAPQHPWQAYRPPPPPPPPPPQPPIRPYRPSSYEHVSYQPSPSSYQHVSYQPRPSNSQRPLSDQHIPRTLAYAPAGFPPALPASLQISRPPGSQPARYRQSCPPGAGQYRSKYLSSAPQGQGHYVPFRPTTSPVSSNPASRRRPSPTRRHDSTDDVAALVQAEIDDLEHRIARALAAQSSVSRLSSPRASKVKSVGPITTTLVTPPRDLHTPVVAMHVLHVSPTAETETEAERRVATPAREDPAEPPSDPVYSPAAAAAVIRSASSGRSTPSEIESAVLVDKPKPDDYSQNLGLFQEIRRVLTFKENYVDDLSEDEELEEYTDEFDDVVQEYAQKSRELGLNIVKIGTLRRTS